MKSPAEAMEEILEYFYSLVPEIRKVLDSPDVVNAIRNYESSKDSMELLSIKRKMPRITVGPNIDFKKGEVYMSLVHEDGLDEDDLFSDVYKAILGELYMNLDLEGSNVIYTAIGHDWRLSDAWNGAHIVGIDSNELNWERPNTNLIKMDASDTWSVRRDLERRGLPEKYDYFVSKGINFLNPETKEGYRNIIDSYLNRKGYLVALNRLDIYFADQHFDGKRIKALSPKFKKLLKKWKKVEDRFPVESFLGFWRSTEVEVYRKSR
jgi:hypothetical protein